MERFMSKGNGGVMSKDYFRQRGATTGSASTKAEVKAPPAAVASGISTLPSPSPPLDHVAKFNGAASRKASLGVGSQIMSKNHFRTLRPPKSKGMDGEGDEPPGPTRSPSPPTLRRADTWAGSSTEEVPVRGGAYATDSAAQGAELGIWTSCPALTLIEKRRKEEELLDKKHQEAISLWREIEGEGLDSLVLEVPSSEEDEDEAATRPPPKEDASPIDHWHQHQHHDVQHAERQNATATRNLPPAEAGQQGDGKIERMPSAMGDEEQDISDMTESNGVSEREDNGSGRHNVAPKRGNDTAASTSPSAQSKAGDNGSKSTGAVPVRRGTSALSTRSRKEHKEKIKMKRASVLGVAKEDKGESDDDDDDDDDDSGSSSSEVEASTEAAAAAKPNKPPEWPLRKPGLYVGRFYSSLRRKKTLTHGRADSDSESDDDKTSAERKAGKRRDKAEKKRKQKEKKREKKDGKADDNDNENNNGNEHEHGEENEGVGTDGDDSHYNRRGTMPKNFKMHFMEKLKSGETGDEKDEASSGKDKDKDKDTKKKKNNNNRKQKPKPSSKDVRRQSSASDGRRGSSASVLSYSEPEIDSAGKNRIGANVGESSDSSSSGGELKKQLKKAQKKNKAQEEKIRKQQYELERMRKELERVRRQRKERRRKETEGGGGGEKEKKGKKIASEAEGNGREDKRKAAAKKESEDDESSKGGGKSKKKT